ncbi:MAG: 50S ribosomal protein L23 [Candidatus Margulisbacteria bacterium]|nr:50S ribosomal protein L23 [Candidatus Margulisiibacteriota bacterium]MBU1616534.1 50S ribosomal protein L23 [Candidatus Margulisiibacteriota bacterium]
MEVENVILGVVVTEKSMGNRPLGGYVFRVNLDATKIMVKQAVERLFKTKVKAVNMVNVRPKRRVVGRSIGETRRWKKAYVTLHSGQTIKELEA